MTGISPYTTKFAGVHLIQRPGDKAPKGEKYYPLEEMGLTGLTEIIGENDTLHFTNDETGQEEKTLTSWENELKDKTKSFRESGLPLKDQLDQATQMLLEFIGKIMDLTVKREVFTSEQAAELTPIAQKHVAELIAKAMEKKPSNE